MEDLAKELTALMNEVEAEGFNGSSDDENPDPRMKRISDIATMLYYFDYDLLDERFKKTKENN
jgi:hypothetical protein